MFVYVCIYVGKKQDVWGLTTRKSPVSVIYCSLVEFNGQEKGLTTPDNLFSADLQYHYMQVQSVLTVLRVHRVCALWNSSLERAFV